MSALNSILGISGFEVNDEPIPQWNLFIVKPVSAVRPSSVTDNLRGRYHTISGCDMLLIDPCGIGTSFTLHLLMMNFHCIGEVKIISSFRLCCLYCVLILNLLVTYQRYPRFYLVEAGFPSV